MAAGGGRRWQDDLEPNLRSLVRQRIVTKLVEMFKADQRVTVEKLHSFAASVEEGAFNTGASKADYMRRLATSMQSVHQDHERALQTSAENQLRIAQQVQLGNPVLAIQGGSSLLARTPHAASMMASPVRPSFQQPHMADSNMRIRPSNTMAVVNQNFNPQSLTFAPMVPGVQSRQQIVQSIPMQSQNKSQAMQRQHPSLASYNQASMARLHGQPVVRPNAQPNHLPNQNTSGIVYGLQQQSTKFIIRNQQGLGVNQHQTNSPLHRMVGPNNVNNSHQNVGCTSGLHSPLNACEQEVLKNQTNMESQLVTPACGQVTFNQPGNVHCPGPQTTETMTPDQTVDWREKMFQQIQSWKAACFSELVELNRIFVVTKRTEEQLQSLPKHKAEAYKRSSQLKGLITGVLNFLHLQKSDIPETCKEKLPMYETTIHKLLDYHRKTKAHRKGSNIGKGLQVRHGKPQTIDRTGDKDPVNGGNSNHSQHIQSMQPPDASISQMRQSVVTETPLTHQKTDSSDPQGARSPCISVKSPGGSQSPPNNDVGLCCLTSPIVKSGVVEVASPYGSLNSTLQSTISKPGVVSADLPCASIKSSLTLVLDKSGNLAAASSCASMGSTLLSTVANSAVVPVASPCNLVKSTAPDDINNYNQVTPSDLTVPASMGQAQTAASRTEDVLRGRANTAVAKKPIDRLLDAVRASSPAMLRSSVNSIKSALIAMDSVPLPPWSISDNNMKRAYDITSSYSESPSRGSFDISGAAYDGERAAKRQKTQNAKEVLLDEIESINSKLIDTAISILWGDPADKITSCNGGTLIKLMCTRVPLAPCLKSHPPTSGMHRLVAPVTLWVPADYPASSPTLVCDEEDEQLRKKSSSISEEVDAAFRRAFRVLPEPRSVKETASAWDACVRRAIIDFAQQHAGGVLGSSLGRWESCVSA